MIDLVIDSNGLSDWVEGHAGTLALLEASQRAGGVVHVPTVCMVESLAGDANDARTNQLLKGCQLTALTPALARDAARLRASVDADDIVDAVVVATAAKVGGTVVSVDPDITLLASRCAHPPQTVDRNS